MKNLKFPEVSKEKQQSIYGATGSAYSDDFWDQWDAGDELDPVYIGGGDSGGDFDWEGTFGDGQNDADDYYGGSGSSSGDGSDSTQQQSGWDNSDFLAYYEGGDGVPVSLHQIGHFENIRNSSVFTDLMSRVETQIDAVVESHLDSCGTNQCETIEYDFLNVYDFTDVVFPIGSAIVSGVLSNVELTISPSGNLVGWTGDIYLTFHDVFEDPIDIYNKIPGTIDYADPFIINESWTETINGTVTNTTGEGGYDSPEEYFEYEYGY